MIKPTVVKLGGSLLDDPVTRSRALESIAASWSDSNPLVVVHGGGKHVDRMLAKLGIQKQTIEGLRVTDDATLEVVVSALAGVVNKTLVAEFQQLGVSSVGLTGADGETVIANRHAPIGGTDLGHVGVVADVHPELVRTLTAIGLLPLVGSVAIGRDGSLLNVNADSFASSLAVALGASRLVFMTDVEGVEDATGQVIGQLDFGAVEQLLASPFVTGGMKPKLRAVLTALAGGVAEIAIAGPSRHASVLFDGKGGTNLVAA